MPTLKVSIFVELGVMKYKPMDEVSKLFMQLIKSDHLNRRDIDLIKKIGFRVILVQAGDTEL